MSSTGLIAIAAALALLPCTAAAIVMGRLERVNLVGAMITGVKRRTREQSGAR